MACHQAVQYIEQGHIRVGPDVITDPAFLVNRHMEDFVTWVDTSKLKRHIARYSDQLESVQTFSTFQTLSLIIYMILLKLMNLMSFFFFFFPLSSFNLIATLIFCDQWESRLIESQDVRSGLTSLSSF